MWVLMLASVPVSVPRLAWGLVSVSVPRLASVLVPRLAQVWVLELVLV